MKAALEELKVPTKIVVDSAAASVMHNVDYVLVGAEAVVENGGVINRVGLFVSSHLDRDIHSLALRKDI